MVGQVFRCSGVQEFRCFGVQVYYIPYCADMIHSGMMIKARHLAIQRGDGRYSKYYNF